MFCLYDTGVDPHTLGARAEAGRVASGRPVVIVDVVILAWNDGELLDSAVASALASVGVDVTVTVVDNGSDEPVPPHPDPRVTVARSDHNLGVAAGRNRGVRLGKAPVVCILDSDARLEPECLGRLAEELLSAPEIGLVAPVFVGQAPEDSGGRAPGLAVKAARALNLRADYRSSRSPEDRAWDVDFAIGACQMFRRAAYEAVDGIDERYFYGPEDVDFCLRLREAGNRVRQVGDAACHHPPRRRFRNLATRRGVQHATAVVRHLWRHRRFDQRVRAALP